MDAENIMRIEPLKAPLDGAATVPGDKSISHRAVLFSAMAEGTSRLTGVLDSADVRSSIDVVTALGAKVNLEVGVDGSLSGGITGWGAEGPKQPDHPLDCGNSGTTARLLMGVVAPWPIKVEITGDESLKKRPMRRVIAPLMKMGVHFEPEAQENLPITEIGNPNLKAITYDAPMASAQLKTAVLLAGLGAEGETRVNEPALSRNHTDSCSLNSAWMQRAPIAALWSRGPATLKASEIDVPGDPSSAAFLICAGALEAWQLDPGRECEPQCRPYRFCPYARAHGRFHRSAPHGTRGQGSVCITKLPIPPG